MNNIIISGLLTKFHVTRLFTLCAIPGGILLSSNCNCKAAIVVAILGGKTAAEKFYSTIYGGINLSTWNGLDEGNIAIFISQPFIKKAGY